MRRIPFLLVLSLATMAALPAGAAVNVRFTHPEGFTDAGAYSGRRASDSVLTELRRYMEGLGTRYLTPGQDLSVEVLDVDLAGRFEPWTTPGQDLRILRDVTWPRITLRYTLSEAGKPVGGGEESIADMNYLTFPSGFSTDPLRYEKRMLDGWFRDRFQEHAAAR